MAYGGRLSFWLPTRGINFGVSEFVNSPYSLGSGPYYSIWQPYFNYHRGNWDVRFEYGNSYEDTRTFIGNNQQREGMYAQVAYRDYNSLHQHLQRLEYVFRFSDAFFHGLNQSISEPDVPSRRRWPHRSTAISTPSGSITTSMPPRS